METVPTPKRGQRVWTDAHRETQAQKIRARQIWLKSTGPKTTEGKRISSRNSYKHGRYTHERKILGWYTRLAAIRIKQLRTRLNLAHQNYQNELRDKYAIPAHKRPDVRAFYPYFDVHPLSPHSKLGKKPRKKQNDHEIFDYFTSLSGED